MDPVTCYLYSMFSVLEGRLTRARRPDERGLNSIELVMLAAGIVVIAVIVVAVIRAKAESAANGI